MPQLAPWLASVGIEIAGISISGTAIAQFAAVAALSAHSAAQQRKAARAARDAYNASLKDRVQTVRGTLLPRQLVMGKVRVGGAVVFVGSTGATQDQLTLVIALASHQCAGVDAIYFNDEAVPLDGSGYATDASAYYKSRTESASATIPLVDGSGAVALPHVPLTAQVSYDLGHENGSTSVEGTIDGVTVSVVGLGTETGDGVVQYTYAVGTPMARVRWMLGSDGQAAFADLITQFPTLWTTNHRLRGITYLVVELTYDPDIYPGGIPNVSALVRGTDQVYDPRTAGTGYSDNPALLLRWYALHPFGGRRTTDQIDDTSVIAAANVCDTSVDYGAGSVPLYTAGAVASAQAPAASAMDDLAEAMAGHWGYSTGRLRMRAGALGATVAAITADWLAGPVTVQPRPPRADLANVVQGSLADASAEYRLVPFPRIVDAPAVAEDGAELSREVEYAAITRGQQAQQVATVQLREARQALTATLDCNLRAYSLQVFDVVSVTLDRFGWTGKLFEVRERSYTHGGAIRLVLRETAGASYAFGGGFAETDPAPNTALPNAVVVPVPTGLFLQPDVVLLSDGAVDVIIESTWDAPTDASVAAAELEWRLTASTDAPGIVRTEALARHVMRGLQPGYHYTARVRFVNSAGVRGNWSAPFTAQAGTDTTPPENVANLRLEVVPTGVTLRWDACTAADYDVTELRFGTDWSLTNEGDRFWRGRADHVHWFWVTPGTYNLMAVHWDSSGNRSTAQGVSLVANTDGTITVTRFWQDTGAAALWVDGTASPASWAGFSSFLVGTIDLDDGATADTVDFFDSTGVVYSTVT